MKTILASLRSIALAAAGTVAAAVLVAGVEVRRSSLTGFDVAGQRGLDADEAVQVIEAIVVDAGWTAPVSVRRVPKTITLPVVKAVPVKRAPSFYAMVVDAVKALPARGVRTLRNAPIEGGERVAVSCSAGRGRSADEHRAVARATAAGLRSCGLRVELDGSTAMVIAS